ncbi:MAG TPA: Crp/Fnr family transcriptional regulator [Rhodospirillaceae bacterium]|nr:Crp/Fnr family transcriptional regulator [Rhodospirillaceae bacterium]MAX62774.1 Crp/Fnr family transcriptional regulator [Rhodospirillaceae bacterium]MBB57619.1 Crp/Fnr family transcriptional regulator [Rhodospirillaceae bacterium]HAE01864.1 Crp/Fnr family transcriptional regulator [Rhodospirillaceae bacterium]HAJ22316.1 Crp/Fnr family transcriptional regulator [Rhodospirillaceae bacterium]|tara:strand:+ start:87141 stop:87845 length:705 start_codon:yes stop_codon:yes gene_type:complete
MHEKDTSLERGKSAAGWIEKFEGLAKLDGAIKQILMRESAIVTVPEGTVIFGPGKPPENLLLLLEGRVRVHQISEGGREIVLYRVEAGQSCVLTTACLLAYEDYSAEGVAETDIRAAAIPRPVFDTLISQSVDFRNFIFTAYSKRITDLFLVIEEIAFQRLDIRLAQKLLDLARGSDQIKVTHQQLAAELGTAREVISRQLGEFQRRDWIQQTRGTLGLLDRDALTNLASLDPA